MVVGGESESVTAKLRALIFRHQSTDRPKLINMTKSRQYHSKETNNVEWFNLLTEVPRRTLTLFRTGDSCLMAMYEFSLSLGIVARQAC